MKALAYDAVMTPLGWLGLTAARRKLVRGLSGHVLEVGTGTGLALPGYPDTVTAVTAIDVDEAALARAQRRRPDARLLYASVESLPFPDASFDAVVSSLVFCSVEAPARALAEVLRVLRPGGALRMLEHVRAPSPTLATVQDLLTPAWMRVSGGCRLDRDTFDLVRRAGFDVERRVQRLQGVSELIFARRPAG
ncbi:methyltransferase domain-containing protein [Myxococcus sp. AM009]|uniref:class I SAM-dependent methyltransferase n=1 Tax=unclassified Myxococcus TaxID=2648731 RepID=UPI001595D946|nr:MULTISPECIES: SAM-dependent methyltransferase [unclassified Myxococcus]NVJ00715.1 methyltransferase domain-containing protein [Myxococcus sp. AM009]NVJ16932.1 methyltransferase domain-containing protein [Myxococcus sp. AM010]